MNGLLKHAINHWVTKLNKISKIVKDYPFVLITVLVSIVAVLFFIYLPFQINLFPENVVRKLYYVDNISDAHLKIIEKFNEKYKNEIEVVPVNLPFHYFTTNDRKAILTRSLRNRMKPFTAESMEFW